MAQATTTTDHKTIRKWVEDRGGSPATVKETGGDEPGILRIDFPGGAGDESLQPVSWDDFFDKFDKERLAFLHQDKTDDGKLSRFCKFVARKG
jgi:hypothetical protein